MKIDNVSGGYVRDTRTGAVLSINSKEAEAARKRKFLRKQKEKEEAQLKQDVDELKNDIFEIKRLLNQLIEKV